MRRAVLFCGSLAAAAGVVVIVAMPFPLVARASLVVLWLLESLRELLNVRQGNARLHELEFSACGKVTVTGPDGKVRRVTLAAGSVVLRRLAWFRLRFADGLQHGELFRRGPGREAEWFRLQLIWRHRRTAFGRHDGSDTICRPNRASNKY